MCPTNRKLTAPFATDADTLIFFLSDPVPDSFYGFYELSSCEDSQLSDSGSAVLVFYLDSVCLFGESVNHYQWKDNLSD